MRTGDIIWVRAYKSDGSLHRWFQSRVLEVGEDCIITFTDVGNPVYTNIPGYSQPVHRQKRSIRTYYWPGRRYTLLEVYEPQGHLYELYADLASPIELAGNEIHYIDHELDVSKLAGEPPRIVDQDEFAEAAKKYGYSDEFVRDSYALAEQLVTLLATWRPRGIRG